LSTVEIRNPEGTELLGEVELTDPADVAGIVARAARARRAWTEIPMGRRADLLEAAASLL
jgi:acyl-CoA reductase-like NAD-dependent aldehyde dehydrogenase